MGFLLIFEKLFISSFATFTFAAFAFAVSAIAAFATSVWSGTGFWSCWI